MNSTWKNRVNKVIPPQYFLLGMIVGILIGMCIIMPLSSSKLAFYSFEKDADDYVHIVKGNESGKSTLTPGGKDQLYDEVKVLCWIMTGPKNHKTKAIHIKATWGRRCNVLLFMSTENDTSLPSIALPVVEDRDHLWEKTKEAFKFIYKNYFDEADWFFKADDDTYTVMENMRYMLHYQNSSDPVYFGFRFKPIVKQGYMSGGAGYVLSKEALKRFVVDSLPDPNKCKQDNTGSEDAEIGKCLEAVDVEAGDSRDNTGRSTFMPLYVNSFLMPDKLSKDFWFWSYVYYPFETGIDKCCSDYLITVHYTAPENLYLLEYLIYHVKPFGLSFNATLNPGNFGANRNKTTTNSGQENSTRSIIDVNN